MKLKILKISKVVIPTTISYFMVLWGRPAIFAVVDQSAIQILAILVGLVIAAVGVMIATVGNLFSISLSKGFIEDKKDFCEWLATFEQVIKEIKDDTVFLILMLVICLLTTVFKTVDIPHIQWIIPTGYFDKITILTWLSLSCLFLSFVSIFDVVMAMFGIHKHYEILLWHQAHK